MPLVEWSCFVFGMRCVGLEAIPDNETDVELVIVDFSPFAVSTHREDRRDANFSRELCYASELTGGREIFDIDIHEERELSFVETRRTVPRTSGVLMDLENILFLRVSLPFLGFDLSVMDNYLVSITLSTKASMLRPGICKMRHTNAL